MALFRSTTRALILQDSVPASEGTGVWAQFSPAFDAETGAPLTYGEFETEDAAVADRLRDCEGVEEVKAAAEKPVEKPAKRSAAAPAPSGSPES